MEEERSGDVSSGYTVSSQHVSEIADGYITPRILALYADEHALYAGIGNMMVNVNKKRVCASHSRSIRAIAGGPEYIACGSYDGEGTVVSAAVSENNRFIETIEGMETEIKGIAVEGNRIAVATRGKTVWIIEDFEIAKIIDDHTQDAKGCTFHEDRLYTWSYDKTIKMYETFEVDHSWELIQSIEMGCTVWNVLFFDGRMCASLHSGELVVLEREGQLWERRKVLSLSLYPIMTMCLANDKLVVVCNRSCLVVLDRDFNMILQTDPIIEKGDLLACTYVSKEDCIACGGDNGLLYKVGIHV